MGVESVDDRRAQPTLADPLLILTGRSFREAVDLLVSARPGFVWRADDDIVHVLRAGQDGSVLARSLESFSLDNVTPLEALHQLCEAFQRTPSRGRGITYSGPPPSPVGQHRFTVRTMSSSLLHVLDAIADQHGALIWHVTYTLAVAAPMTSNSTNRIGFVMFDGWGVFIDECIPVTR